MLGRGNARVSPNSIGLGYIHYGIEGAMKVHFRVIKSWTAAAEQGEVTLVNFTLRVDIVFRCLKAGMGCNVVGEGLLYFVPLIVVAGSWKLTLRELAVVFLMLLRPWGWDTLHGWARSMRGS